MDLHDLTAAYALDALDVDESRRYEQHLSQCDQCQVELASLSESATALAWAVDAPPPPPAALRARILEVAAAERENVTPLRPRDARLVRVTASIAAVAACIAVGLGVWSATLRHSIDTERSARGRATTAVEILADPSSRRVPIDGGRGVLAVGRQGQAVLVMQRLPHAPSGKTYEAWVIPPGGSPHRAGVFHGGDGTTVVRLERPVGRGYTVATTIERDGGVAAPTGTTLLRARA